MLSKARIKFIKSLQLKKYRKQEQCFVVEGGKSVLEVLNSDFEVIQVLVTPEFYNQNANVFKKSGVALTEVKASELSTLGEYSSNDAAMAIVRIKANEKPVIKTGEYVLMLDDLRDPGNLGTIIRTADWYGITKIIASTETADLYNGKVIQSSMGSFTRVSVYYTDIVSYLQGNTLPVLGAFLDGDDVHKMAFTAGGIVVIGNEANGISAPVEDFVTQRITIPRFGHAESLNAAIAAAIICDNIKRGQRI